MRGADQRVETVARLLSCFTYNGISLYPEMKTREHF